MTDLQEFFLFFSSSIITMNYPPVCRSAEQLNNNGIQLRGNEMLWNLHELISQIKTQEREDNQSYKRGNARMAVWLKNFMDSW